MRTQNEAVVSWPAGSREDERRWAPGCLSSTLVNRVWGAEWYERKKSDPG